VLAAWWIVQLIEADQRVLIIDYEAHPTEWSRRIGSLIGTGAMTDVFYVAPLTPEWTATRGPLWETAHLIRSIAEEIGATYIVIDSIVPACAGMDPTQPEVASQYASALQLIAHPALSLAHVTKADDARYPFGSVFWHNLARSTWSLSAAGERGSHGMVLTHRKHNNYPNLGKYQLTVAWRDGLPVGVQERAYSPALAERIGLLLGDDALTVAEIVAAINDDLEEGSEAVKPDSIRKALRRGLTESPQRFAVIGAGTTARWSHA
jgi:hypothetical protein